MMVTNTRYEFTLGGGSISVIGLQDYSPGQIRKVDVWKVVVPEVHANKLGGAEFSSWGSMLKTLADVFCGGHTDAASARLILKFDHRA